MLDQFKLMALITSSNNAIGTEPLNISLMAEGLSDLFASLFEKSKMLLPIICLTYRVFIFIFLNQLQFGITHGSPKPEEQCSCSRIPLQNW